MESYNNYSDILIETVGLSSSPVGIKFFEDIPEKFNRAGEHRFCQLVMRARRGESLVLTKDDITCPAALVHL